jgi:predicted nucleotidyltransferase
MNPARLSDMQFGIAQEIILSYRHRFDEVRVFGSRATGKNRPGSDLDLALVGADSGLRAELLLAFDESDMSITVDVVDFDRCSNEVLKAEIRQNAIVLLRPENTVQ